MNNATLTWQVRGSSCEVVLVPSGRSKSGELRLLRSLKLPLSFSFPVGWEKSHRHPSCLVYETSYDSEVWLACKRTLGREGWGLCWGVWRFPGLHTSTRSSLLSDGNLTTRYSQLCPKFLEKKPRKTPNPEKPAANKNRTQSGLRRRLQSSPARDSVRQLGSVELGGLFSGFESFFRF